MGDDMMRKICFAITILAVISAAVSSFLASSDAGAQSYTRRTRERSRPYEERFWDYLKSVEYKNWAPGPGQNGDFYPGESPHGAFLKMYLNRTAIADAENLLPHGSVVIKENYGPDKKTLMAITVMFRSKGYDPEHNDWYWVKYMPDGTVAKAPPDKGSMKLAGKVKGCIMCHGDADGDDFAFIND